MPGHHVQRVLGNDPRRHLQHEAAELLADGDIVRFQGIENALARRSVGNELPAGQLRAERAALCRMLTFRLKEKRVLAPHIDPAFGAEGFVNLGNFGGGRDRIADDTATNVAHDMGDRAVAVNDLRESGIFRWFRFHGGSVRKKKWAAAILLGGLIGWNKAGKGETKAVAQARYAKRGWPPLRWLGRLGRRRQQCDFEHRLSIRTFRRCLLRVNRRVLFWNG